MKYVAWVLLLISTNILANEPIKPLPPLEHLNKNKLLLGKMLFNEKGLSGDHTLSCASCHNLKTGGVDRLKTSTGIKDQKGPINAPTVYNAKYNVVQFWDGRAKNLKEQAAGPITNPLEMGANWPEVIAFLKSQPRYVQQFKVAFDGHINQETVTEAISDYEKTLMTPSTFDLYLRGDKSAISPEAKRGYRLFKSYGCTACHNGVNAGGALQMKIGVVHDYFKIRGGQKTEADNGRYNVTKKEYDRHVFKVPTLRNVDLTAPYFHDGHQPSLKKAVWIMGKVQLGRDIPQQDIEAIVAFLKTLNGIEL